MYFTIKDPYRQAVEAASGGRNTVRYDDKGYPSVLVCIPKFNIEDVTGDAGAGTGVHPMFLYHGKELPEVWIGKYQAKIVNGRACSMPMEDPTVYTTFDNTRNACRAKGKGWHLLSRAEQAGLALLCAKSGYMPRGNTATGKAHDATYEHGVMGGDGRVLTGSGPVSWAHDGTAAGIYDLCGNIWEWNQGMKLINGKIYVVGEDGVAMNNFDTADSENSTAGYIDTANYLSGTAIQTAASTANTDAAFSSIAAASGVTPHQAIKQLALMKCSDVTTDDHIWANHEGERVPSSGGDWHDGASAGVFALRLNSARSHSSTYVGGRVAYAEI